MESELDSYQQESHKQSHQFDEIIRNRMLSFSYDFNYDSVACDPVLTRLSDSRGVARIFHGEGGGGHIMSSKGGGRGNKHPSTP